MPRRLVLGSILLVTACSVNDAPTSSDEPRVTAAFSPYPNELRPMKKLGAIDPFNTSIANFGSPVRDQGKIASCASHGFIGMLENQLFLERGITVALSERFMLYGNFLQTGNMGTDSNVITRFAEIAAAEGVMSEALWPYADLAPNAARFDQDAAQGLHGDPNALTIDKAIAATAASSRARSDILVRPEFLGALPPGPYPITLPLAATLEPGAKVPEVEYGEGIYSCFDAAPETLPAARRLAVTPREVAAYCLDIDPSVYFTCVNDVGAIAADADAPGMDACTKSRAEADHLAETFASRNTSWLNLTAALVARGQAVMVGVKAPQNIAPLTVWFATNPRTSAATAWGAGHAVLVVGYLTYDELADTAQQRIGVLGDGIFDALAGGIEPEFAAKVASHALPTDPAALRDARLATKLALLMRAEGGILLFRNSWGAKVGNVEIGYKGYQSMTFEYFLRSAALVESRAQPRVAGVGWQEGAGPAYCPSSALPAVSTWVAGDHRASLQQFFRGMAASPACPAP